MKCPLKVGGEKRVSCSCEREACAWWVERTGTCAVVPAWGVEYPKPTNDEMREFHDGVIDRFFKFD